MLARVRSSRIDCVLLAWMDVPTVEDAYLLIGIDSTPLIRTMVVLFIDCEVVTLDLKLIAKCLSASLSTFNHTAQRPVQAGDKLASDHLQQFVARWYNYVDLGLA